MIEDHLQLGRALRSAAFLRQYWFRADCLFRPPVAVCLATMLLGLPFSVLAQPAKPEPTTKSEIRFQPTRAQQNEPRVRAARESRSAEIRALFAQQAIDYPPAQVLLRIFKADDILELWARPRGQDAFVLLKQYAICARSGELGPKRQRGDLQVPEGFYQVSQFFPRSQFHLALLVSYPNESDRIRARARDPGGSILVHGACCTIGCIPITDRWIEELYLICLDTVTRSGTNVLLNIFPTRLDETGMQKLREQFASQPGLLSFWEELRTGFELFEKNHVPPRFTFGKDGAYRF